ncbi:MAG: hypothetical protein IT373_01075 [Polyangiaceae bacterium]|nr:hypothetical protein [Polyangiaceae bacterium]
MVIRTWLCACVLAPSIGLASLGCGTAGVPFECTADAECTHDGAVGRCEKTGYCSFPDASCEAGLRYGELAPGELASQCFEPCVLGLALGGQHSCALLRGGSVACWGNGKDGRLGDGRLDGEATPEPVRVDASLPASTALAAGGAHTCALAEDGTVWCWGKNDHRQLGVVGAVVGPLRVTALDGAGAPAIGLAAGGAHSCARASVGTGCWGSNERGQLGRGSVGGDELPAMVDFANAFQEIAAGDAHGCGRTLAGTVHCWGDNAGLQVGGPDKAVPYPTPLMLQTPARAASLELGTLHSCMVSSNEGVECWGNNLLAGQLGRPQAVHDSATPLHVALPADATQIAAGATHSCALDVDGRAWCWGGNEFGQHGPGRAPSTFEPEAVVVELPGGIVEIAAGAFHTCARTAKDEVYCWGANEAGQLGNGRTDAEGESEPDATVSAKLVCE